MCITLSNDQFAGGKTGVQVILLKMTSQLVALLTAGQSVCLDIQESAHAHRHTNMYACIPTITEAHTEKQRAAEKEVDEEEEDWGEMQTQC